MRSPAVLLVAVIATATPSLALAADPPVRIASTAARARTSIELDGRDDEPAWKDAALIDAFRMTDPTEGGEARLRTVARILYDDSNLYVLVRAFDPHPDSIVALLSRRDVRTQSDHIRVMIDSYHDRRTGYSVHDEPGRCAARHLPVQRRNEDLSWDGVWDVKTIDRFARLDRRVPHSARASCASRRSPSTLRRDDHREVARSESDTSWPLLRRSQFGIVVAVRRCRAASSRYPTTRRLELRAVFGGSAISKRDTAVPASRARSVGTVGADLKLGLRRTSRSTRPSIPTSARSRPIPPS